MWEGNSREPVGCSASLGRDDELDIEGLRRLAQSITRYTDVDGGGMPLPGAPGPFVASRPLGGVWLLDGLWRTLRVDRALGRVLGPRRFTTAWSGCCSRWSPTAALDPCSKLAAQWERALPLPPERGALVELDVVSPSRFLTRCRIVGRCRL
jgi:hypothetical protein